MDTASQQDTTILDRLGARERSGSHHLVGSDPAAGLTGEQFATRVAQCARALRQAGARPGHCHPVTDPDPLDQLITLAAANELGAIATITDPTWPRGVQDAAITAARAAVAGLAEPCRERAALVVFTSGSTGTPKPVIRSLESWTRSYAAFSGLTGIGAGDIVLIPGRLSASLFLFGTLHALASGATVRLLPRWSAGEAASATSSATVVHLVPTMLADLIRHLPTGTTLRLAACAGAQLPDGLREHASELGIEVFDYYGASELSFVAIREPGASRMRPFPGVEVTGVDGILRVRSPYLAANVAVDDAGYATVGDRGVVHSDRTITVLGRGDAVITSGGATVVPEGVETVLKSAPDVAEAIVVGRPHPDLGQLVTAIVEPVPGRQLAARRLRALAADRLPRAERPRDWLVTDQLPRTSTGKVARADVDAALAAGTLPVRRLT